MVANITPHWNNRLFKPSLLAIAFHTEPKPVALRKQFTNALAT